MDTCDARERMALNQSVSIGKTLITRCDVIKALRIKLAILESSVSTSPENREIIRPKGEVSKKSCGALIMPAKRSLCSTRAPRIAPTCTRKLAKYNARAVICRCKYD